MSRTQELEIIRDPDGHVMELHGLVWTMSTYEGKAATRKISRFDFSQFDGRFLDRALAFGHLLASHRKHGWFSPFFSAMVHLWTYSGDPAADFAHWTETEWGDFMAWSAHQLNGKGEPLSVNTRRLYMTAVRTVLRLATSAQMSDIGEDDVEALVRVMTRRFRDSNLIASQKAARRAWTSKEREHLIAILNEEWWAWRAWHDSASDHGRTPDLLTVTAAYLCWEETVRPEEINVLTVADVDVGVGRLRLHAPNKNEYLLDLQSPASMVLLKAVLSWGHDARVALGTDAVFVEPVPTPRRLGSSAFNHRLRSLLKRYGDRYPIYRPHVVLADGRKTFGSILASRAKERVLVQVAMRHVFAQTTNIYYIRQGKEALSHNVSDALQYYAGRLAMAWNAPVLNDPIRETPPEVSAILQRNPNHSTPYGACSRDAHIEGACDLGIHCGTCPKLIPMASKVNNFIAERDMYIALSGKAQEAGQLRMYENRLYHAGVMEAHIQNIERRLEKEP